MGTRFETKVNLLFPFVPGWDCHGLPVEYEIDKMFNIRYNIFNLNLIFY